MTTIDFSFMFVLVYVLGLLLGVIPDLAGPYWKLAGLCYLAKTGVWFALRIPLLLPIDRWERRGSPPADNDPALIRSIYFFPYDFSVFYGFLIFFYYSTLISILIFTPGSMQVSRSFLLPGLLFAAAIATGAVAIGVPVNLLLTAKFSRRLSERDALSFNDIPGKEISLRTKMATVALAVGCAPSLLLYSFHSFTQQSSLYQEASRTAVALALKIEGESVEDLSEWALSGAYPFDMKAGVPVFSGGKSPPARAVSLASSPPVPQEGTLQLWELRVGHVLRFTPGSGDARGVVVTIPQSKSNYLAVSVIVALACFWPLLTSLLIIQTIVNPVSIIAAFFHRIIGRGRIEGTDRVPVFYKDEVGRLAFNANQTVRVLTEARQELEETTQNLAQKNRELEEAYRTKGEFLANMSHELRTPLNAIIGFSRITRRKLTGTLPERQEKNLQLIEESGEQLLILVNDLLDFEKIEAGKMIIRSEEVDLDTLCEALVSTLTPQAQAKGIRLELKAKNRSKTIISDKDRLRQILTNLMTNAIKYSDKGRVELRTELSEERLLLEVQDQGIGMTEAQVERIFDPFHQVDGSETRERGGVGLGLAIVGRLVKLLGGTITVSSVKDEGSTFSLDLPARPISPLLHEAQDALSELSSLGDGILLIEDDVKTAQLVEQALEDEGFRLDVLHREGPARERLKLKLPSVLILDLKLDEGSGWGVLEYLLTLPGHQHTRVLLYTASDLTESELSRARDLGVSVVTKHGSKGLIDLVAWLKA